MTHTPLSERVKAQLDDPQLVREVEALERLTSAGVANVAANGRFPHWPIDRWITVLGFAGVIIGGIFVAGSWKAGMERDVAELKVSIVRVTDAVERNEATASALMQLVMPFVGMVPEPVPAPSVPARRRPQTPMAFPRSEQFQMPRGPQE